MDSTLTATLHSFLQTFKAIRTCAQAEDSHSASPETALNAIKQAVKHALTYGRMCEEVKLVDDEDEWLGFVGCLFWIIGLTGFENG